MLFATHIAALVFRLAFFVFAGTALLALASRRDGPAHVLSIASIAALFASASVVGDAKQAVWLAGVFAALAIVDVLFVRSVPLSKNMFLPVAILAAIGAAVAFDAGDGQGHCRHLLIGCAACAASLLLGRRRLRLASASYPLLLVAAVALCALPLVPGLGHFEYGALVGVRLAGRDFGPAELAKVTLAVALAGYVAANARRVSTLSLRGILPIAAVFSLALGAELLSNDLGTGLVMFSLVGSMFVLFTRRAGAVYGLIMLAAVAALILVSVQFSEHVAARFAVWLDPYVDPQGSGYQLIQIREAVANGGLIGTGLHFGSQFPDVFSAESDGVIAVVVEELGVFGGALVALCIAALCALAVGSARSLARGSVEQNLAVGGACLLAMQSFVILGGSLGVIPLTGVPLPFVSHGGSSLISCLILVGLMGAAMSGGEEVGLTSPQSRHLIAVPALTAAGMAACMIVVAQLQTPLSFCGNSERIFAAGDIVTSDGAVLATTPIEGDDAGKRMYPEEALAPHLAGLYSGGIGHKLGEAGIDPDPLLNLLALPEKSKPTVLTLCSNVQKAAEEQLEGKTGAIVALNSSTGAVIAMASSPSYDPSAEFDPSPTGASYLDRAVGALYAPGSTFKLVTAAAALDAGCVDTSAVLEGNTFTLNDGRKVANDGNEKFGGITLADALRLSSNTAFADLALTMGSDLISEKAMKLGFGTDMAGIPGAATSSFAPPASDYSLAWSAVGQPVVDGNSERGPRATVVQMCSVMAAIANGGIWNEPYVVASSPLIPKRPEGVRAMAPETAEALWGMLAQEDDGTGFPVAGKTGTAEEGAGTTCWYVCASGGVAVACAIESDEGEYGATEAMPRAEAVLRAALAQN